MAVLIFPFPRAESKISDIPTLTSVSSLRRSYLILSLRSSFYNDAAQSFSIVKSAYILPWRKTREGPVGSSVAQKDAMVSL